MKDSIVSGKCVKANLYMKVISSSCDVILPDCTVIKRSCKKKKKRRQYNYTFISLFKTKPRNLNILGSIGSEWF